MTTQRGDQKEQEISGQGARTGEVHPDEAEAGFEDESRLELDHPGEETEAEGAATTRAVDAGPPSWGRRTVKQMMRRARARLQMDQLVSVEDLRRSLARSRYLSIEDDRQRFRGFITRTDVLALADKPGEELIDVRSLIRTATPVGEDESPESAARALLRTRAHVLPVVDSEGRFLGLVSDHAVLRSLLHRRRPAPTRLPAIAVDAVMTQRPVSIGPDGSVEQAAGALLEAGVRHLPVVDADMRVIGIISERDIRERIGSDPREWFRAAAEALEDQVERVMTPDPLVVRTGSPLADALEILESERVGALPVVDENDRLAGMLSYVDALAWIRDVVARRRTAPGAEPPSASE